MATQQAYQAYAQSNKGTLVPGQTISVNKYTVQVERYLSQGGFAHVYLVRTPAAVYGTTHHVLKRIAVANEAMLSEVKTEVDVMRVLKGHPNIVHLIDAAWHRMPNGMYEVFILMEYCPGGGIIDMMNRRLRERLTEAEILQIFVDVCEGVAFMHNSRPPLLHRDLKVENILQSSSTSYKLCDFGSATTVSRPPTNTQEIRALEAEIGRHTTMQYRAPEMIDLYSKRPIDEKSDVWALGVLLYKLCYYTTPFEEHGSLAILNVQYRIPPYPMYSSQMNMLIGSMLREHGSQRPSVYEVLNHVHYLRGTKSQFTYNIPAAQPIAPRQQHSSKNTAQSQSASTLNDYVVIPPFSHGPRNTHASTPSTNPGAQAREKVLEAIAPMRRGRPANTREPQSSSRPASPQKSSAPLPPNNLPPISKDANWLEKEEATWKVTTSQAKARDRAHALFDDAWKVSGPPAKTEDQPSGTPTATGFDNDFAEKLWRAPNPNAQTGTSLKPSPSPNLTSPPPLQPAGTTMKALSHTGNDAFRNGGNREKDAFEGLGLMTSLGRPAPTLAEARKLRTGLAIMSHQAPQYRNGYTQPELLPKPSATGQSVRPTPSPRPSYLSPTSLQTNSMSRSPSPGIPTGSSWQSHSRASPSVFNGGSNTQPADGTPIESRFPSLEEIDAKFTTTSLYPSSTRVSDRETRQIAQSKVSSNDTVPQLPPRPKNTEEPSRSSQSTAAVSHATTLESLQKKYDTQTTQRGDWKAASFRQDSKDTTSLNPPSAIRPKRSSTTMKYALEGLPSSADSGSSSIRSAPQEDKFRRSPKPPPKDWLTGDDEEHSTPLKQQSTNRTGGGGAVLRDSPVKRASVIVPKDFKFQSPVSAQHDTTPLSRPQELPEEESPTISRFTKTFPPIDTKSSSEAPPANKGLSDNWSPIETKQTAAPLSIKPKQQQKEVDPPSSTDEDGPEDLGGIENSPRKKLSSLRRRKGRQSSVHDLVDLWGGGLVPKEKGTTPVEAAAPKPFSVMDKATPKPRPTSLMPPLSASSSNNKGSSPKLSPIQRDPSPSSPYFASWEASKEKPATPSPSPQHASARSRPQSMFIFPAKPTESLGNNNYQSPPLATPVEETPKAAPRRRTSISNMVQRYEAIGGKVIAPQQVPTSTVLRKASINRSIAPQQQPIENVRVKVLPVPDKVESKVPSSQQVPSTTSRDEYRPSRITTNVNAVEPSKVRTRTTSTGPVRSTTSQTASSRTSPIEIKRDFSRGGGHGTTSVFPKRKPTLPVEDVLSPPPRPASRGAADDDQLSSSPEKPYLGVGRLIDQWQKKSAEAAPGGSAAMSAPPKRAGLVNGSNRV